MYNTEQQITVPPRRKRDKHVLRWAVVLLRRACRLYASSRERFLCGAFDVGRGSSFQWIVAHRERGVGRG